MRGRGGVRFNDIVLGLEITKKLPDLSQAELAEIGRLALALNHALDVAAEMPTTLDAHARGLVVEKLQEAEHWMIELVRRGSS